MGLESCPQGGIEDLDLTFPLCHEETVLGR
jgi:hypothetical protein